MYKPKPSLIGLIVIITYFVMINLMLGQINLKIHNYQFESSVKDYDMFQEDASVVPKSQPLRDRIFWSHHAESLYPKGKDIHIG